jgi:hypothetical protein
MNWNPNTAIIPHQPFDPYAFMAKIAEQTKSEKRHEASAKNPCRAIIPYQPFDVFVPVREVNALKDRIKSFPDRSWAGHSITLTFQYVIKNLSGGIGHVTSSMYKRTNAKIRMISNRLIDSRDKKFNE